MGIRETLSLTGFALVVRYGNDGWQKVWQIPADATRGTLCVRLRMYPASVHQRHQGRGSLEGLQGWIRCPSMHHCCLAVCQAASYSS
jgi:hypothetical protein